MEYNKYNRMNTSRGLLRKTCLNTVWVAILLLSSVHTSYAQSYVPVQDDQLSSDVTTFNNDFNNYVTDLWTRWDNTFGDQTPDGTTDSLRDLISGYDPQGALIQPCAADNNVQHGIEGYDGSEFAAYPYDDPAQPWYMGIHATSSPLPNGVPDGATVNGDFIQVNRSESLRCLLIEIAEWQKLGISVQIHGLLKTYISDAQQAQLTKQLKNRITATNLQFAKSGNQVNNNGVQSTAPVFVTNFRQNLYDVKGRQVDALSDQAAADPTVANPQGSLGICQPWRIDTAISMVENARTDVEDPSKYTSEATECSLTDPNTGNFTNESDYFAFQDNFNDPSTKAGGYTAYLDMLNNPQNTPLGSQTILDKVAEGRIARQEDTTRSEAANSGFLPTKKCSGDASDPHCLDDQNSLAVNPGAQNQGNITNLTEQMNNQITSDSIDTQNASSSTRTPSDINTNTGLMSADTLGLETSQTAVNDLVREYYDTIYSGYFGINENTREWAQGTLLMIYDEMKFNPDLTTGSSATVVTDGTTPVNTGY